MGFASEPTRQRTELGVASVIVGRERETDRGWRYGIKVIWKNDRETLCEVALSWHDHDYWSGGATPPSRVIEAVVRVAGDALGPEGLTGKTDAATLRRLVPELDDRVMGML